MEGKNAFEDSECEDREEDRRRGELEAMGAQYHPVGCERASGGGLAHGEYERHGDQQEGQVGEERAVDAAERAERGAIRPPAE